MCTNLWNCKPEPTRVLCSPLRPAVVSSHIGAGKLPYDKNAIYLVLTSQNVTVDGFCSQFCGYHSYFNLPTTQQGTIYGLIGDANQCLSGCAAQR